MIGFAIQKNFIPLCNDILIENSDLLELANQTIISTYS